MLFLPLSSSQVSITGQIRQKALSLYGGLRRQHDHLPFRATAPEQQQPLQTTTPGRADEPPAHTRGAQHLQTVC